MKVKAFRKHSLHEKTAASILLKLLLKVKYRYFFHINIDTHEPIWQNTKTFIKNTIVRWRQYRRFEIKHLNWQNILFLSTVNGQISYCNCGVRDTCIVNTASACLNNVHKVVWWKRLTHKLRNEAFKNIHHIWKLACALETHRVAFLYWDKCKPSWLIVW